MATFWLSFAEPGKPLGVIITTGDDFLGAMGRVNEKGINPGGEVCAVLLNEEGIAAIKGISHDVLIQPDAAQALVDKINHRGAEH